MSASAVQEGNSRALVRPARNATDFNPASRSDGTQGFVNKRSMLAQRARAIEHKVKRDLYAQQNGAAVEIWDTGCEVGKLFAEAGDV